MLSISAVVAVAPRPSGAAAPWTVTIATETSGAALWAYPFLSGGELTAQNVEDFEQLTYRPLYFFAGSSGATLDRSRSLAEPPVYSNGDTSVAVTMKPGLSWSNGASVGPDGVVEWMNLVAAFPGIWADYLAPIAGGQPAGIPDDVRSISVDGETVTFSLSGPVNPTWFTDNELSQITPLPSAWDRYEPSHPHVPESGPQSIAAHHGRLTGATAPAGCYTPTWIGDGNNGPSDAVVDPLGTPTVVPRAEASQAARCVDVVDLLRSLSADAADYTAKGTAVAATWSLSDGPWRLSSYDDATGRLTLVVSTARGVAGPRPEAHALEFVPCADDAACLGLLEAGAVDQGTLPIADAPRVATLGAAPAHNPLTKAGYRETAQVPWAISYAPYNFDSTRGAHGKAGLVLRQPYVRQALQLLDDQPTAIRAFLHGDGAANDAPVPVGAPSALVAPLRNPYPFDARRARTLLSEHGWRVAPGGVSTCAVPKECGSGILAGTPLSFTVVYSPATEALTQSLSLLRRDAEVAGISLHLDKVTETEVLSDVLGHGTNWDLASWDGGWSFAPDYYPSGEWLFAEGSSWNVGDFHDATATSLVVDTLTTRGALSSYDALLAARLPVLWLATPATLTETLARVHGVVVSPTGALTPESWRLSGRSGRAAR